MESCIHITHACKAVAHDFGHARFSSPLCPSVFISPFFFLSFIRVARCLSYRIVSRTETKLTEQSCVTATACYTTVIQRTRKYALETEGIGILGELTLSLNSFSGWKRYAAFHSPARATNLESSPRDLLFADVLLSRPAGAIPHRRLHRQSIL